MECPYEVCIRCTGKSAVVAVGAFHVIKAASQVEAGHFDRIQQKRVQNKPVVVLSKKTARSTLSLFFLDLVIFRHEINIP